MPVPRLLAALPLLALAAIGHAKEVADPAIMAAARMRDGDYAGAATALGDASPDDPRVARLREDLAAIAAVSLKPGPAPKDRSRTDLYRAAVIAFDRARPLPDSKYGSLAAWLRDQAWRTGDDPVELVGWALPRAVPGPFGAPGVELDFVVRGTGAGKRQPRRLTVVLEFERDGTTWKRTGATLREPPPPWYAPDTPLLAPPSRAATAAAENLLAGDYAAAAADLEGADPTDPRIARLRADLTAIAEATRPHGPPPTDPALAAIHRAATVVGALSAPTDLDDLLDPSLFGDQRPRSQKHRALAAHWVWTRTSPHPPVSVLGWSMPHPIDRRDDQVTARILVLARHRAEFHGDLHLITVEVTATRRDDRWLISAARAHEPPPPWYAPDTEPLQLSTLADVAGALRLPAEPAPDTALSMPVLAVAAGGALLVAVIVIVLVIRKR